MNEEISKTKFATVCLGITAETGNISIYKVRLEGENLESVTGYLVEILDKLKIIKKDARQRYDASFERKL